MGSGGLPAEASAQAGVGVGYAKASIAPVVRSILVSSIRLMGHDQFSKGGS